MYYVESINQALHSLMASDERVFVLGEDILDPYGGAFKVTKGLSTKYPERVITTPISEGAITGFAIGMAVQGLRPIVEIMFGDFITLCADQIINSATKFQFFYNQQVQVPLVIRTPMGGRRGYGPTHSQTLESIFLGTPGLTIIAPSNFHCPGALLTTAVTEGKGPVLFIENKMLYPQTLRQPDDDGRVGDLFARIIDSESSYPSVSLSPVPNETPQITLITYGGMAPLAVEATLNVFMQQEINVEIILPSMIKPFPIDDVLASVCKSGRVIIAEEGARTSGWGAELGSQIYQAAFHSLVKPIVRIGAKDVPIPATRPLEDLVLPQVEDIEAAIYRQAEI